MENEKLDRGQDQAVDNREKTKNYLIFVSVEVVYIKELKKQSDLVSLKPSDLSDNMKSSVSELNKHRKFE